MNLQFIITLALNLIASKGVPAATAELTSIVTNENSRVAAGYSSEDIATTVRVVVGIATKELDIGLTALAAHLGK